MVVDATFTEDKIVVRESIEIRVTSSPESPVKRQHSPADVTIDNDLTANSNGNSPKTKVMMVNGMTSFPPPSTTALIIHDAERVHKHNGLIHGVVKPINGQTVQPVVQNNNNSSSFEPSTPELDLIAVKVDRPVNGILRLDANNQHLISTDGVLRDTTNGNVSVAKNIAYPENNNAVGIVTGNMCVPNMTIACNNNNNRIIYSNGSLVNANPNVVNRNATLVHSNISVNMGTVNSNMSVNNSNASHVKSNPRVVIGTIKPQGTDLTHLDNAVPYSSPYPYNYAAVMNQSPLYTPTRDMMIPVPDFTCQKIIPSSDISATKLAHLPPPPPIYTDLGNGILMPPTYTSGVPVPGFVYGVPSNTTCYVQPSLPQLLSPLNSYECQMMNVPHYPPTSAGHYPSDARDATASKEAMTLIPGSMVSYATVPPTTISMPTPLCPSASMELVWHGEFDRLFSQYHPHVWYLMPTFYPPSDRWQVFKDSAKVRFSCQCGHGWTSMKGRVIFWFYLNYSTNTGYVLFKLYGQECMKCKAGNYEHAMWYPEEVIKVIGNVYNRVGQLNYGFVRPPLRIDRRQGKPRNQHNSTLCQACKEGLCKEEWSFS